MAQASSPSSPSQERDHFGIRLPRAFLMHEVATLAKRDHPGLGDELGAPPHSPPTHQQVAPAADHQHG